MAFIKNNVSNDNSGTSGITSAEISDIKKEYVEKSEDYSSISDDIIKCDKVSCQFNIEGGKCSLEFCFYDDTEWKPSKDTFKFNCRICDTTTIGDIKNPNMRLCPICLKRMKELGTLKTCKLCGRSMDPKTIKLWQSGICDRCTSILKRVIRYYDYND